MLSEATNDLTALCDPSLCFHQLALTQRSVAFLLKLFPVDEAQQSKNCLRKLGYQEQQEHGQEHPGRSVRLLLLLGVSLFLLDAVVHDVQGYCRVQEQPRSLLGSDQSLYEFVREEGEQDAGHQLQDDSVDCEAYVPVTG